MTGHEALQVAHVSNLKTLALLILIFNIVIKDRDVFVSEHERGDFVEFITKKGTFQNDLFGQSHSNLVLILIALG